MLMRIFVLSFIVFPWVSFALVESIQNLSNTQPDQYEYSIKNLPKAVEKNRKKPCTKYIPGDFNYSKGDFDAHGNNHAKHNTDLTFNHTPELDDAEIPDGKRLTHRQMTDKHHKLLRNKMIDTGIGFPEDYPSKKNMNINNLIKSKALDKIIPSFKAEIDL